MSFRLTYLLTLGIALLLSSTLGCRSDPPGSAVPEVTGLSDGEIMAVLAGRAKQTRRIMSSGTMRVETDDQSVTLDVALLASGDRQLRLRAWKIGRAVFDLTRDGDDLWLWHADKDQQAPGSDKSPHLPDVAQLNTGWQLISGQVFATPPDVLSARGPLIATYRLSNTTEPKIIAEFTIARSTQTVERIVIRDEDGQERAVYKPTRYRLIEGVPWPTKLALRSDAIELELTLDDIELNGQLPPSSFKPPRDARKLP